MPKEIDDFQLIRTKLNRPRVAGDLVSRPRPLDRLNRRLARPLTLVVAPAGYGKTTLITDWLETWAGPSAWLSLDEHDSDLNVFLTYFLAAIHTMFPDACSETTNLLKATSLPPLPVIVCSLINELNDIDVSFLLVLDDYHSIREPAVHQLLTELLRYPPEGMRLVIASRRNPLLPLTWLRGRGLMTEVRTQDLRFTVAEAAALVQQMTETQVDEAVVSLLEEKTEGWVTGLRLAVLSTRHRGDFDNLVAGLQGSSQYVMDYLISEVLTHQPPDIQDFLIKSSILNRLCGSLCETVVGPDGSEHMGQTYLEAVSDANLFLISLDDQRQWFRYHHLFKQFLQQRLQQQYTSDEIAVLHTRATDWFAQNGLIEEALHHALAADDLSRAVQLVARHRHGLMNQDQWQRLGRWLRLFPSQVVETEPELLMLDAWLRQVRWQLIEVPALLDRIQTLLASPSSPQDGDTAYNLQGEIDALLAIRLLSSATPESALAYSQRSLPTIPHDHYYVRGFASLVMGCAYQLVGDPNAAIRLAYEGLQEIPNNPMFQTRLLMLLCLVYWMEADLDNLWLVATRCHDISFRENIPVALNWARYFQGCVYYHRNDLAAAEQGFCAGVERPHLSHGFTFTHGSIGLALTHQAQGQPNQANQVVDSLLAFILEMHNSLLLSAAQAFQAELSLYQGRLAEAGQWAARENATLLQESLPGLYAPQLTLPKILLAQNTPDSRQQAASYLSELRDFVESIHNTRFLIEVLALEALLHQAQGNRSATLDTLTQAVTLAQPGGFIRLFLDLGPELEPLLADLAQNNVAPAYIAQILAASDSSVPQDNESLIEVTPQPTKRRSHSDLIETLTNREMDVLLLMAERLTNKEIAQELGISTETVKQHAINLYRKLHVNNRRQAVAQARALGILPAD